MSTKSCASSETPFHVPSRQELIDAANSNRSILEYRQDKEPWSECWCEEVIAQKPPMRVEFEHAIVFSTFSEALSLRKGKSSWGALLKIEPLRPDDILHPFRVVYQLKPSSRVRQRWEFRDTFKKLMGRDRALVTETLRMSKKAFLSELTDRKAELIRSRLGLTPEEFWRAVHHGERYGPNGIHNFVRQLEEQTKGLRFDFDNPNKIGSDL